MNRDRAGRYSEKNDVVQIVVGAVLLAALYLVLNHFNAARLDQVNAANCAVTGTMPDCVTSLNAAN